LRPPNQSDGREQRQIGRRHGIEDQRWTSVMIPRRKAARESSNAGMQPADQEGRQARSAPGKP